MRVLLRIQDIHFLNMPPRWWHEPETLSAILGSFAEHGLLDALRFHGPRSQKHDPIQSIEALVESSVEWKAAAYTLTSEDNDRPAAELMLDIKVKALSLRLAFDQSYLKQHQGNIISQMIDAVCALHSALGDHAMLGPVIDVELPGTDYPQPRPPRFHRHFLSGSLATIICRRFHQEHRLGVPDEVQKLLEAPLPEGTQRLESGDLVIFRWVDDLADERQVQTRRSAQAQWLGQVLELPRTAGYNDQGDYLLTPLGPQQDPILTSYNPGRREGYKAVVVFGDGTVEEELFAEIQEWVRRRQLPDGRPLERLNLIVPVRESALQLRERATQIGVRGVYYIDNQGRLWDPFPPGMWVGEPR